MIFSDSKVFDIIPVPFICMFPHIFLVRGHDRFPLWKDVSHADHSGGLCIVVIPHHEIHIPISSFTLFISRLTFTRTVEYMSNNLVFDALQFMYGRESYGPYDQKFNQNNFTFRISYQGHLYPLILTIAFEVISSVRIVDGSCSYDPSDGQEDRSRDLCVVEGDTDSMGLKYPNGPKISEKKIRLDPLFTEVGFESIPRTVMPASEMSPDLAYQIIHDELMLDGNARLNLATFVGTWMEPQAQKLANETFDKNIIDKDEYPQTAEIEMRCVSILSHLWNSPDPENSTGCSTTGSSEAAMLGGLAMKRRWQHRMKSEGKSIDKPNIVMGINVQVCWEKFANYWDVEMRLVPMEGDRFNLSAGEAVKLCDENTIGVVTILGSTFDGSYEPVKEICDALDEFQRKTGVDVPVHVDAASGGMLAPFIDPELVWDFRLPRVVSINASGHKYGLVYPGVGWIVWRDTCMLPKDLIFNVNYLGSSMPTFALNFSRSGSQVILQYYNFLRLGFEGYRKVHGYAREVATYLSGEIEKLGPFELITRGDELPVFAFRLSDDIKNFTVFDVSNRMRERGWLIPAYTFPANRTDLAVLRVVVRRGFSHDLADMLLADLKRQLPLLESQPVPIYDEKSGSGFHH